MKRLYLCLAVLTKGSHVQTVTGRYVANTEEEATGAIFKYATGMFPDHSLNNIWVEKISSSDILEILENMDVSESQAKYIKLILEKKGHKIWE